MLLHEANGVSFRGSEIFVHCIVAFTKARMKSAQAMPKTMSNLLIIGHSAPADFLCFKLMLDEWQDISKGA